MQVLYLASDLIIANVRKRLPVFFDYSERYTGTYLDSIATKRATASQLPDEAMRTMRHESVRNELVIVAAVVLKRFRALKRYIALSTAFKSNPETFWKACQWEKYASAANQSWVDVTAIGEASIKFITEELSQLTADHNMPGSFQDLFEADFLVYQNKLKLFEDRLQEAKTGTESKLDANNELYNLVIQELCLTGQYLFEDSAAISSEYSFEAVSQMLEPGSPSAVAAKVTQEIDGVMVPMQNVDVTIVGTDLHESTNAEGAAEITRLSEGPVRVRFTADGFVPQTIDTTLDGTRRMLKIIMVPLFTGEMKVGSEGANPQGAVGSMQEAAADSQE
ncbi:MAG: carboxypeptidase-like regulatory domain-containing protein [Bacteroidota bacterium]